MALGMPFKVAGAGESLGTLRAGKFWSAVVKDDGRSRNGRARAEAWGRSGRRGSRRFIRIQLTTVIDRCVSRRFIRTELAITNGRRINRRFVRIENAIVSGPCVDMVVSGALWLASKEEKVAAWSLSTAKA